MSPSLLQSSSSPPSSSWSNFLFTSFFLFCEHRSDCDWSLLSLNHCVADRADGDGDVNDCCVLIMIYETSLSTVSFLDVLCLQMGWLSSASGVKTAVPGNHCKSGRDTFVEYLAHICHIEKTPLSAANWVNVISRNLWCQNIDRRCFEKATCKIHQKNCCWQWYKILERKLKMPISSLSSVHSQQQKGFSYNRRWK